MVEGTGSAFKICPRCGHRWFTRETFLSDGGVAFAGYQGRSDDPEKGFLLFNHREVGCETSFALMVSAFSDLSEGPVHEEDAFGTPQCRRLCLDPQEMALCEAPCRRAYVRQVIQIILERLGERRYGADSARSH